MTEFKRGIDKQDFIAALKADEFWNTINNDPELFVGIRGNYINAYFKGNNICKLEYQPRKKRLSGKVHYKYLTKLNRQQHGKSPYIDIFREPIGDVHAFISCIKNTSASEEYASEEKIAVHSECIKESDVLDVEITFTSDHPPIHGRRGRLDRRNGLDRLEGLDRLDYLKLEIQNGKPMLVFYEAKTIANSEIKAQGTPHVIEQMRGYTETLRGHATEIVRSYNMVCDNIRELGIRRKGNLIGMVQNNLTVDNIDDLPRLIIFGYDKSKESSSWGGHYEKLKKELGDRVILREG
jgi:hypothetical protein